MIYHLVKYIVFSAQGRCITLLHQGVMLIVILTLVSVFCNLWPWPECQYARTLLLLYDYYHFRSLAFIGQILILLVQWDKIILPIKWLETRCHLYLFYVPAYTWCLYTYKIYLSESKQDCSTSTEKLGRCWEKTRNWNDFILTDVKRQNSELFVATCLLWDNSCLLSWGYILVRDIIQMIDYGRNLPF